MIVAVIFVFLLATSLTPETQLNANGIHVGGFCFLCVFTHFRGVMQAFGSPPSVNCSNMFASQVC